MRYDLATKVPSQPYISRLGKAVVHAVDYQSFDVANCRPVGMHVMKGDRSKNARGVRKDLATFPNGFGVADFVRMVLAVYDDALVAVRKNFPKPVFVVEVI